MLVDMITKLHKSIHEVSSYYFRTGYNFTVNNLNLLIGEMSSQDRMTFNCDVNTVTWRQHFDDCYMRFRRSVLNEPDSNVSDALKRVYQ